MGTEGLILYVCVMIGGMLCVVGVVLDVLLFCLVCFADLGSDDSCDDSSDERNAVC